MQAPISLAAAVSVLIAAVAALPQAKILPRAAGSAPKPKYSVVALEPGEDSKGDGHNGPGAQTVVETVVKTVVKTEGPTTQTITRPGERVTITNLAPTTVPVVPIAGNTNTNTIVTVTVSVTAEHTSGRGASESTTTTRATLTSTEPHSPPKVTNLSTTATSTPPAPELSTSFSTSSHVPDFNSSTSRSCTETTITTSQTHFSQTPTAGGTTTPTASSDSSRGPLSSMTTTTTTGLGPIPTTLDTVLLTTHASSTSTSTKSHDDGKWHTTYPAWNESAPHTWRKI
ncbi:hypothetical protein E4U13_001669 [Claviceps humidiphila]|uniref:Uncharacterized protein n=1 Tax=Claviceps humidiphila TaxID=1294629 RepID=A0A9P7TV16_9HYPO|nr:hypothetical protein E4U13_001669 [Claviceps humidiphila]